MKSKPRKPRRPQHWFLSRPGVKIELVADSYENFDRFVHINVCMPDALLHEMKKMHAWLSKAIAWLEAQQKTGGKK